MSSGNSLQELLGKAASFWPENQGIAGSVSYVRVASNSARREGEQTLRVGCVNKGIYGLVLADLCPFSIIQPSATQLTIVQRESQRMDQVQEHAGIGAETYNVACIGCNFRFVQDDVKHGFST